jgi:zinc/manganese transport system ATP-binding protein
MAAARRGSRGGGASVVGGLVGNGVSGTTMAALLQFRDLTLGYDRHPAIHHLSGVVEAGTLTAVVGPNGAGKSTLFKGIVGLLGPLTGMIEYGGIAPIDIAYLSQTTEIDRTFPIHVYDLVAMGLWRRVGAFGGIGRLERGKIDGAIAAVGLTGLERRQISGLSGGQLQRALFARLLLQESRLIVLDEPFNAIDDKTVADLIELIRRWHREGRTVLAALHDFDVVRRHFPQTLLLAHEAVAWGETGRVLTAEHLMKARRMCAVFDEGAAACSMAAE